MVRPGNFRIGCTITGVMLSATVVFAGPLAAAQQTGSRVQVLVRPLATQQGAIEGLGRKVSQRVRDRLRNMAILAPISEEAVEDELERLKLDDDALGLSEWRQLAGRLDADLLLYGTITKTARGHDFQISFIDVRSGDATPIPLFTVEDDDGRGEREAADRIMDAMESQAEYERANRTTARYLRGRIEMSRENWQAAKENFDLVIGANPADVDALKSLGYTEAKLGNKERARELYNEVLGFNPDAAACACRSPTISPAPATTRVRTTCCATASPAIPRTPTCGNSSPKCC